MPRKKFQPIDLDDELWGEKLRRAFYRSRSIYGQEVISHRALAARISQVKSISPAGVERYFHYDEKPPRQGSLQTVYLICVAMGVNPEAVDIHPDDITNELYKSKAVHDLLIPLSPCFTTSAA